jgi:hypothetical protein
LNDPQSKLNTIEKFPYGKIINERNENVDKYLGRHNSLPKNFKRNFLAKFGMNNNSLNPNIPDIYNLDSPESNHEFLLGKLKFM